MHGEKSSWFFVFVFIRYPTGKQDKPPPTVNLGLPKASLVASSINIKPL